MPLVAGDRFAVRVPGCGAHGGTGCRKGVALIMRAWLHRRKAVPKPQPVSLLSAGKRLYCIGDIHGRADLLDELHQRIAQDAEDFAGALRAIYLGDYIDRGAASKAVIERLSTEPLRGFEHIFLLGNHEQAMLDFLVDPRAMATWLSFGGIATLRSYGLNVTHFPIAEELNDLRDELRAVLPAHHLAFLQRCQPSYAEGGYYFVHAGIRPRSGFDKQRLEDQLWIREEFTRSSVDHGAIVVHGHTITEQPEILPNRIGIDTGAYHSGVLTGLVLEANQQRVLQTGESRL